MSLSPTNNNLSTQATRTSSTKAEESKTTSEAAQATSTPEEATRATPDLAAQDATRQLNSGRETELKNQLDGGWLEAGNRRTRSTRGTRRTAQATPTRGLGGSDGGGSEMA